MSATSRATTVSALIVTLSVLTTLLIGLRAVSRFAILKKAYIDDYLSIVALFFAWAITILCLVGESGVRQ